MGEKTEAKYATEAYELFRLFDRIGRSFYGLLLAEIGWLFLLLLASKIVGDPGVLVFPVLHLPNPPYIEFEDARLAVVAVVGAIIIGVGWIFYSRLHHFIVAPTKQIIAKVVTWLSIIVFFLIALLNVPLLLLTWPLERLLLRLKMKKERKEWIGRFYRNNPQADGKAAYKSMVEKLKEKHGEKIMEQLVFKKIVFTKDCLVKAASSALMGLMRTTQSSGRIGIAPLVTHSYSEDYQATKVQLQVFAVAIGKMHSVLRDFPAIKHLRFYSLPYHVKILNEQEAVRVARLFGLDVILWGSYLDDGGETIWMNIYSRFVKDSRKVERDKRGFQFQYSIFPNKVEIDTPAVIFSQKDHRQAYVVLLVAMIQALQGRRAGSNLKWLPFRYLDQLYLASSDIIDELVLDLVTDALRALPAEPLANEIFPSANTQLVEIAGKWVGHQFAKIYGDRNDSLWARAGKKRVAEQLYEVAEKCSLLLPEQSENFYRLGAIACLLGDPDKALTSFKRAGDLDSRSARIHYIGALVLAEQELANDNDDELSLVRFATHAACAINTGDEFAIRDIKKAMAESFRIQLLKDCGMMPMPIPVLVIDKMLEDCMQ